jgi:phosphatidylglycerophosphate synthase
MLDDRIRPVKERVLAPVARALAGRVSPAALTFLGFVLTLGAAGAAWRGAFGLALAFWLAGRLADGLDGVVARIDGTQSSIGAYLDIVLDTAGYAAVPLALAAHHATADWWMAVAVLLASFYLNTVSWGYLSGLLASRARDARGEEGPFTSAPLPRGLIEGAETVVLYALILVVPRWSLALVWVMAALVLITAVERVRWGMRRLEHDEGRRA